LRFISKIRPEYFFVVIALFFHWRFNKVTPPFQVPDEFNHFYKAYKISQGEFLPIKENNRLGGTIPWSVREYIRPFNKVATNVKYTTSEGEINGSFDLKFSERDSIFVDFPNTAIYSVVSYAPQAFAIFITKQFKDVSVGRIYYNGRYITFLCWLVGMFFVIRLIPFGKWLMTLVILLPMNLYVANSFSADTVTNILGLLFIAYVLKLSLQEKKISYWNIAFLLLMVILLTFAKVVYVGLVILILVIPPKQFKNIYVYASSALLLFLTAFLVTNYWSATILEYYTPYLDYNPKFRDGICLSNCAHYYIQKQLLIDHKWYFINLIYRTILDHPVTYLSSYIGSFGSMDLYLPRSVTNLTYAIIFVVGLVEKNERVTGWLYKILFIGASLTAFALLSLSQHLTWDCIGEDAVDLIQGRYLIPLLPLLFLVFSNTFSKYQWIAPAIILVTVVWLNRASCKLIYPRYFKESYYEKLEFSCDAEKVNEKGEYLTSHDSVFLEAGKFRTDSFARSGKYSAYCDPWIQYQMSYRFKNLRYGDVVEMSAWQKGNTGELVLSAQGTGSYDTVKFFFNTNVINYRDEKGWGYMNAVFTVNRRCDSSNAVLFLWSPDSTKRVYFDDLKVSIKKYKGKYLDSVYIIPK
jgi:uncharacterized membrane protein